MPETPVNLDAAIDTMLESINRDLGVRIVHRSTVTAALAKAAPLLLADAVAAGRTTGPCCQDALDSDGNAHAEDCRYLAGVRLGRKQAADDAEAAILAAPAGPYVRIERAIEIVRAALDGEPNAG